MQNFLVTVEAHRKTGKRNKRKNFLLARILRPNKPAKDRLFLSKKSTDDCYLIPVNNKNWSFIPEQRKKRLNRFLDMHPLEITRP